MANQRTIPDNSTTGVVSFTILIDGAEIDATYQIMKIMTRKELNKIATARFVIRDGSAVEEDFEISNRADFIPGKEIEIQAGRDGINETIFKGIIIRHGIKIRENGMSELNVECKDKAIKMTVGRVNQYFEKKKDSDVISDLIGKYGLSAEVDATSLVHDEIVQNYVTDWDFMMSRAEVNSLVVLTDDGTVKAFEPKTSGSEVLTLIYGSTMIDFEAEIDAECQYKEITASSWDYTAQKIIDYSTSNSDYQPNGNLTGEKLSKVIGLKKFELRHSGKVIKEELKSWADAAMQKSRMAMIRGRCKFFGFNKVKPGDLIKIKGVGDRFNGNVFVSAVQNTLIEGTWFTNAQFGLPMEWFTSKPEVSAMPAGGLLSAVSGLQIGKVVQLEEDPDGEDRILVKLPIIDHEAKGAWARVSTLDAGKERGTFFRPEIDDEVTIGFINGDPRDAIVLGMLHSKKHPAPIPATDDNHEKGLVTRSKMRLWFDDDKKIITIETPGGNSIVISEEAKGITLTDQNQNTITMNDAGIEMKSPKDIVIDATGKIDIKAAQDVNIEGLNVNVKASANLKAEGAAGAEVSTSAIAVLKGSLVQIN